jgi:phage-related protein
MAKVIYYTTTTGENPTANFIESLSARQKTKVIRILTYIERYGLVTAIPHVKKLTGTPLWEIRILGQGNIRIFYVTIERDVIIVLHGFIKKSQKTPLKEIKTAINRLANWSIRTKGP